MPPATMISSSGCGASTRTPSAARTGAASTTTTTSAATTDAASVGRMADLPGGARMRRPRAAADDPARERPEQAEIGAERPLTRVRDAEARLLGKDRLEVVPLRVARAREKLRLIVVGERRGVGEARLDGDVLAPRRPEAVEVRRELRPRPEQRQVAAQQVHELGQLV